MDPSQRYFVVTSGFEGATQTATVVDLQTYQASQLSFALHPDTEGGYAEAQAYLAGSPLQLVVTSGGQFDTYPLEGVLSGTPGEPTNSAALGGYNHGPVVAPDGTKVASTTEDGLDVVPLEGDRLTTTASVPYSTSRNVVEVWRPRLAGDGHTVWGSAAEDTGLAPDQWADTRNDVDILDWTALTSELVRLPDGRASRLALSDTYAAVATTGEDGDALTLLDASPDSPTYQHIVGTVALPSLSAGPVVGEAIADEAAEHWLAITPDGHRAFVSHGGDGTISVVDTEHRSIVDTIHTPSSLTGGGYLTIADEGQELHDLVAR